MPAQGLANGLLPATLGAAHENTKIETLSVGENNYSNAGGLENLWVT